MDTRTLSNFFQGKNSVINFNLRIGGHYQWTINLEENELRAAYYRVSVNDEIVESLDNACITYKGFLNNDSSQPIRLSIADDQFEGYIIDGQEILFIRPISKIISDYTDNQHFIIFNGKDVIDHNNVKDCGNEDVDIINDAFEKAQNTSGARATTTCRVLEIATEADFEFYQSNGSNVLTTNNNILNVLNQVEGIYQTTFNIRFLVPFQSVWSTSSDPYTSTSSATVIDELANYWQANRGAVARDVVYFFSGKTGHDVRGRAKTFGAICDNVANSYAFTAAGLSNVNPVITTAHELGHLFNATHPSGSSASCSPTRTIMCIVSCSSPPCADDRVANFSSFSQDEINTWLSGHNACLTDVLNVNIAGTDPVCSTGQFSVTGLPPNSSTTSWSSAYTSGLTITNSGFASRQSNYIGQVNITANGNFGNAGCTFTSTKPVWVGEPVINGSITGAESISCGGTYLYDFVGGVLGSPTYSWQSSGHFTQGVSGNTVALTPVYSGEGYTSIEASNACGTSYLCQTICSTGCDTGLLNFPGSNPCATSGLCGFSLMRVSPNPSSDKLTIKANMKLDGSESKKTFVATISDDQGNTVLSRPLDEEELVIDKGFLKAGTYYVRISLEGRIMGTKRIIIE